MARLALTAPQQLPLAHGSTPTNPPPHSTLLLPRLLLLILQTIELPDANERAAIASDPLASLERSTLAAERAASGRNQLVALAAEREAKGRDPYSINKQLRAAMRQHKKAHAALDSE